MNITLTNMVVLLTTVCVGLMAGLFYSYSFSVMPGLGRLNDHQYLSAMQSINRAIQNPIFFVAFFGVLITLPLATYLNYSQLVTSSFWFLLAATLTYFIGAFLVTAFGNIPLNNALDKLDLNAITEESLREQRQMFETRWNNLNLIRTLSSALAFICSLIALLNMGVKNY